MQDIVWVGLTKEYLRLIVESLDYRLYLMDQENHFFQEEPTPTFNQLVDIRDFILGFTTDGNRVQFTSQPGEVQV